MTQSSEMLRDTVRRCSLNEVEVAVRRSCRGAGMAWGLSFDAGSALRRWASAGGEWLSPLLSLLKAVDGEAGCFAPVSLLGGAWRARGHAENTARAGGDSAGEDLCLCPIAAGCALSDGGSDICGARVTLSNVLSPVLLLGFVSRGIARWGGSVAVNWREGGGRVVVSREDFCLEGEVASSDVWTAVRADVVVEVLEDGATSSGARYGVGDVLAGVEVAEEDWRNLEVYTARTYVAASERSRIRGAG